MSETPTPNIATMTPNIAVFQMKCIICRNETTGSVGAAGIRWPNLCQNCKDKVDDSLERMVRGVATAVDMTKHSHELNHFLDELLEEPKEYDHDERHYQDDCGDDEW